MITSDVNRNSKKNTIKNSEQIESTTLIQKSLVQANQALKILINRSKDKQLNPNAYFLKEKTIIKNLTNSRLSILNKNKDGLVRQGNY